MTGWLPSPAEELFGPEATAEESYDVLTVDVPPASWTTALETARTTLSCTYFDWLSAVDEPGVGFRVSAHVVALAPVRRLLLCTTVGHDAPVLASAVDVYAGAAWHERETHEMFGVTFDGHPGLAPLLLPENFEGHPLRKDFVLAARVAKAWPGAKEPGESEHGGPKRRQMLPPGVPDPNEWGPLKGQLPPAPARPARGAGRAAGAERPARRSRTAGEGSASQNAAATDQTAAAGQPATGGASGEAAPARPARRSRSVSQGSASQRAAAPEAAVSTPAPEAPAEPEKSEPEKSEPVKSEPEKPDAAKPSAPSASDAPWHHARPAFDATKSAEPEPVQEPESRQEPQQEAKAVRPEPEPAVRPESPSAPESPESPEAPESPETPENGGRTGGTE
ncbi:NADH-quinone oxidoreductase subunit C [Streptomyces sp. NPDC087300]|uniref:NADH-quinone oxidoreductase subunit C n=1 Tax=Streptomyces sp. NPDC087300 TaxID=3365780 RepID=UPI0038229FA4